MRVEFRRGESWEYSVHVHRPDGVVVSLPGAGGRWPVPHDLAHFATERALGMPDGVFGSAASGAMFDAMTVVAGRLRHDPKRRSQEILRANTRSRSITAAETLTSVVHEAVQQDGAGTSTKALLSGLDRRAREVWATVREDPFPFAPEQFALAVEDLRGLVERWTRTPAGGVVVADWPDALVTRPGRARPRSGARRG
ncbi:hypothetical protein [Actinopolymorpha rutila]|uniref:Uncharacterized protein n=1 Tax=Actinopolymorpha rutila TaxID=446787 RepID=A0A852ZWD6_9ACTN|nr:hypothetical protein [Actinopolymorpha rutila]NYH93619.1 hypothetical protein [Actinopolymorpha rutila]